jgi:hypothetical protein
MSHSREVERRLAELDAKGPSGRALFEHYLRCLAKSERRSTTAAPADLVDAELVDA